MQFIFHKWNFVQFDFSLDFENVGADQRAADFSIEELIWIKLYNGKKEDWASQIKSNGFRGASGGTDILLIKKQPAP
jgi:hypothetical protein